MGSKVVYKTPQAAPKEASNTMETGTMFKTYKTLFVELNDATQHATVYAMTDGRQARDFSWTEPGAETKVKPVATLSRRRVLDRTTPNEWTAHDLTGEEVYAGDYVTFALSRLHRRLEQQAEAKAAEHAKPQSLKDHEELDTVPALDGCPEGWADLARRFEARCEYAEARDAWTKAKSSSIGHKRRDRYHEASDRCAALSKGAPQELNGYPVVRAARHANCWTVMMYRKGDAMPYAVATWWPELGASWSWGHYMASDVEAYADFDATATRNATR